MILILEALIADMETACLNPYRIVTLMLLCDHVANIMLHPFCDAGLCSSVCCLASVVYFLPLRELCFALFLGVLREPLLVWWYLSNNYFNGGMTWYDHVCKVTLSSIPPVHSHPRLTLFMQLSV